MRYIASRCSAAGGEAGYRGQLAAAAEGAHSAALDAGKRSAGATGRSITMQPIGLVHSQYKAPTGTPIQGVFDKNSEAWVELNQEYVQGLKDLEGFSHAILLYQFHLSDQVEIVGKPYLENAEHGIFAMRSPHRPNHIGLSVVKIKRIEGGKLYFTEVDILDGTPVLDIKPYVKQFDCRDEAVSGWIERHFQAGKQPDVTTAK
jgi:tRNA-Thr(GGU) m(6)t(6)A37 methyltransferase TsaA